MLPEVSAADPGPILEAARAAGLDPNRLRIQLKGRALAAAARGQAGHLAGAARALQAAGLKTAVFTDAEAHALPALQVAGGVAADGEGGVTLRVHGRPLGPPAGVPLLIVVADLGRERARGAAEARPGDSLRQRVLRAVFPVADVIWPEGRVRVALKGMAWLGLPGLGLSAPANFLRLLEALAQRSAGTVVDLGFVGQDLAIDPLRGALEALEGADRERMSLFDRYSAAAALAWARGLYPGAPAGEVATVGASASAAVGLARSVTAKHYFAMPGTGPAPSKVPWLRHGHAAHVRLRIWPWLALGPVALLIVPHRLSVIGLALAGCVAVGLGLRALSLSERLRSLPLSKVRSMVMGLVQISGRAAATAALKAPYSHTECVWFCFEVKDRETYGEDRERWRTIAEGSSSDLPFLVEDPTGSVLVQPADAEIEVEPDTIALDGDMVAREWVLPAGAPVFVTGFAQHRSTDPGQARDGQAMALDRDEVFIGSGPNAPLTIGMASRGQEQARLRREFVLGAALGGGYILAALAIWLAFWPIR